MNVLLCRPRGFCAGVERAIETVERALAKYGPPIYVRHEIVHNKVVVQDLMAKGAVFVDDLAVVPAGSHVIFSAHGVAPQVFEQAKNFRLNAIDATCPLVTKVHVESQRFSRQGLTILLIGHHDHVEVEGVVGEAPERTIVVATAKAAEEGQVPDPDKVAVLTQTTLSVDETSDVIDALRKHFPKIQGPRKDDICYATQNRQDAVREMAGLVDLMLVVGSRNSSNSNRLRELAEKVGTTAYLIDDATMIEAAWLTGINAIGVTAGASAPDVLVQQVIARLRELGGKAVAEHPGREENVVFEVPPELRII